MVGAAIRTTELLWCNEACVTVARSGEPSTPRTDRSCGLVCHAFGSFIACQGNSNPVVSAMNKNIGLQLVVYSLLLAGFSYLTHHLAAALARPTLIAAWWGVLSVWSGPSGSHRESRQGAAAADASSP